MYATAYKYVQCHSLVPSPSHCPVFDPLRCAKTEEGGVAIFYMNNVSVYLGRQRGGKGFLIERTHFIHTFFVLNQESGKFFAS